MEVSIKAFLPYESHSLEKVDFFHESSVLLSTYTSIPAPALQKALLAREEISTTGFGDGMAIPHGSIHALNQAYVFYFRFTQPIEWEAIDDKPVSDCFMLLVPENAENDLHLRLLSSLAYHLADEKEQEKILTITDGNLMEEHLREMMQSK